MEKIRSAKPTALLDYEAIFENTGTAMAIIEENSTISMVNAEFARFWGYSKEEIENRKKWTEIVSNQDLERMKAYHSLRRVSPSAAPRSYEFLAVDRNGRPKNVHLTVSMIEGSSKSIASLIDISERKKTEEQLRKRDSILEAVSFMAQKLMNNNFDECLGEVLSRLGSAARVSRVEIYRNYPEDGSVELLESWISGGYAPAFRVPLHSRFNWDELGLSRWANFLNDKQMIKGNVPDFPEDEREYLQAAGIRSTIVVPVFVSNSPWGFISFYDCLSEREWSSAEVDSLNIAGGIIAAAIEQDIARAGLEKKSEERRIAEDALKEREEFLQSLIDNMMDTVLIIDWDANILFWNKSAEVFSDLFAPEEGVILNLLDFVHPDSMPDAIKNLKLLQDDLYSFPPSEYKIITKKGIVKVAETISTKINYGGRTVAMLVARDITDRRKAEEALKQNEELLRTVYDHMLDSIVIVDWSGTVLFGNNAVALLVGLPSVQEGIGGNFTEFIHPDYIQQAITSLMLVSEDKGGFLEEYKIITRTGEEKIVETIGRKINFGCNTADIIGLRDITQRRVAEEALRESEELFRNLVANMLDCLLIVDSDGNILFANEAVLRFAEVDSIADVRGNSIRNFLSERDFEKAILNLKAKNLKLFNYTMRTARGNERYLEGVGNQIKFRGQDSIILNLRDVTARKMAEQALLEAYSKLQIEMEERAQAEQELSKYRAHLEEIVEERTSQLKRANIKLQKEIAERKRSEQKIKDLNMLLLSTKMITESMLRASTEQELVQTTCDLLAEIDFIKFVWAGFVEAGNFIIKPVAWSGIEDGYLSEVRITWDDSKFGRGPTGTAIRTGKISITDDTERDPNFSPWREQALKRGFHSVFAIPISYRQEIMGYLTVYSSRKSAFGNEETEFLTQIAEDVAVGMKSLRLEKELESKHGELQKAYAELKASEEMVIQQEKLASIGQLAAGIAHEIKNPLAIILQGTEFIKSCIEDEFLYDCAERIKNSANRADNIIKGLLNYSRQGNLNLELGDIAVVLNESVFLVNHQLTLKNIKVVKQMERVPLIRFDSNQMKQVFINILMNAIESMETSQPLNIELRKPSGSACEILIKITDKGCGISRDILNKVCDPFFTTKRKSGGTGLGLSVTKGIIEKHKGRMDIESEIGAGTAISIFLPLSEQGA